MNNKTVIATLVASALTSTAAYSADFYMTSFEADASAYETMAGPEYLEVKAEEASTATVVVTDHATEGEQAVEFVLGTKESATLGAPLQVWNWNANWNLTAFNTVKADIYNSSSEDISVKFTLTHADTANNNWSSDYSSSQDFILKPCANSISFDLDAIDGVGFAKDNILIVQLALSDNDLSKAGATLYLDNLFADDSGDTGVISGTCEEPIETDPVDSDPVETDPVVTDPVETDPVVTDPVDSDPVETDPKDSTPSDGTVIRTGGSLGAFGVLLMGGLMFFRRSRK